MTVRQFVDWAQGYYGPWPDGLKADIRDYLAERDEEYLDVLKKVCLEQVPTRIGQVNGYPPDVAKLMELSLAVGKIVEDEARGIRELDYAAKLLPAPDGSVSSGDMQTMDWSVALAAKIASMEGAKRYR
jgi:hypothetical protein